MKRLKDIIKHILGEANCYSLLRMKNQALDNVFHRNMPKLNLNLHSINDIQNNEKLKSLFLGVLYAYNSQVEGDIVEFGTGGGLSAKIIAMSMAYMKKHSHNKEKKKLHLFDSFEGLPEATSEVDLKSPLVIDKVWAKGFCRGLNSKALVKMCMKYLNKDEVEVYEGWFSNTISKLAAARFSMVHFDGDLYQSTIDALDVCFNKSFLSEGALLYFDDWNCNKACRYLGERKAWKELVEKYSIDYSDCGDYAGICHKFIIHTYKKEI